MEVAGQVYDKPVTCWVFNEKSAELIEIDSKYLNIYGYTEKDFLEQMKKNAQMPEKGRKVLNRYLDDLDQNKSVAPLNADGFSFHALVYEERVKFTMYDYVHVIYGKVMKHGEPVAHMKMQAVFQRKVIF